MGGRFGIGLRAVALGLACVWAASGSTPAGADPILGEWRTEPDAKGQTGDVAVSACGGGFCGTIVRAHDSGGTEIKTRNVGRKILIDMKTAGSGTYSGRVYVPIMGDDFAATVAVSGSKMVLKACNAMSICRSQTWRRLK